MDNSVLSVLDEKKSKKIYIYSLGCSRRRLDASEIISWFEINDWKRTSNPKFADLIILTTCAYNDIKEDLNMELLKVFNSLKKPIIIYGCLPGINPDLLKTQFNGPAFVVKEFDQLKDFLSLEYNFHTNPVGSTANYEYCNPKLPFWMFVSFIFKKRFLLDAAQFFEQAVLIVNPKYKFSRKNFVIYPCRGCERNCSFCGIRASLGDMKSEPIDKLVNVFKEAVKAGKNRIRIVASNLAGYGQDIGSSLIDLLKALISVNGDFNMSIEELVPDYLVKHEQDFSAILESSKIDKIVIPIQSANERVLKLMRRPLNPDKLRSILIDIRKRFPNLKLTTDVIAGFPGETEEEFDETIKFVNDIGFYEVSIYNYSDCKNAGARHLKDKIPKEIIYQRVKKAYRILKRNKDIHIIQPTSLWFESLINRVKQAFYWYL